MSIHTILSQMEEEFEKKYQEPFCNAHGILPCEKCGKAIDFFRSFATRIMEEVGKEIYDDWKSAIRFSEDESGGHLDRKVMDNHLLMSKGGNRDFIKKLEQENKNIHL